MVLDSVHRLPPPVTEAELCTLVGVDDQDAWSVATTARMPAVDWLRATYADAPSALQVPVLIGWRLCGAELGPLASPDHVVGWQVELAEPDRARMRVHWRIGLDAEIAVAATPGGFTLASFVAPRTRLARVVWALLRPTHRLVTRVFLALAARRTRAAAG